MIFNLDNYRTPIRIHGKNQLSRVLHYGVVEQCHNGHINLSIVMQLFDLSLTLAQMENIFIKYAYLNSLDKVIYAKYVYLDNNAKKNHINTHDKNLYFWTNSFL